MAARLSSQRDYVVIPLQPESHADLHHQIPNERMLWSKQAIPTPAQLLRDHPLSIRRAAALLCGIIHIGTLVFWLFYWTHNPFRSFFLTSENAPAGAMIGATTVTLLFQCVWPLRIAMHAIRNGRLLISASLQAILSWTLIGVALIIVALTTDTFSKWLGVLGVVLIVAGRVLMRQIKRAFVFDRQDASRDLRYP